jgi:hypothetical protein
VVTIIALLVLAGGVIAAILVLTNDDGKGSSPSTTPMSSAPRTSPTPTPTPTQRTRPTSSAPTTSAPTTSAAPQTPSGGPSGAESAVANALPATATAAGNLYFRALAGHDLAALRRIACPSTTITLSQPTLDRVTSAEPTGPARATGAAATMTGRITGNDRSTATISAHLAAYGAGWCLAGTQVG